MGKPSPVLDFLNPFRVINRKLDSIMATQAEVTADLILLKAQVNKIAVEQQTRFDALSARIAELEAIVTAGGNATPELTAALAEVKTALQSLDDTIPDAQPAPTP